MCKKCLTPAQFIAKHGVKKCAARKAKNAYSATTSSFSKHKGRTQSCSVSAFKYRTYKK